MPLASSQTQAAGSAFIRQSQPIFILGLTKRTGSNYLWDLLRLHPETVLREPIWEDHLIAHADQLVDFVDSVKRHWPDPARVTEPNVLLRCLGDGLVSFLNKDGDGRRVVTKTPSVANVAIFFEVFPEAQLLILVRDGRSVAESMVRSFGFTYASATRDWATAARTILSVLETHPSGGRRYRIVQYERLLDDLEDELGAILDFLGLDRTSYDFEEARNLPLRGSSVDRGGQSKLHWQPIERPPDFHGRQRWSAWSAGRHRAFNLAAGDLLSALGYEPVAVEGFRPWIRAHALVSKPALRLAGYRPFRTASWYRRKFRMRRRGALNLRGS